MTKKIFLTLLPLTLLATPNAPTKLHLTPTKTTVLVSWKDKSENETGFKIFRNDELIYTTKQNEQAYLDKGLEPERTYHYEVKATDDEQTDYISVPKKIYKNQPTTAYLNNMSQSDKDWVGIFYDQRTAKYKGIDRKHLLAWSYKTKDTDKGEITVNKLMAGALEAGDYEARVFFDDSYDTVAKAYFTIVDENPPLQVSVDDSIKVSYQNTAGNDKDWIAIYEVGSNNEWENVRRWTYTDAKIDGEISFPILNKGEYEARVFYNNSYIPESVVPFSIGNDIVGTNLIETYGAVCDGDTNDTHAIQNALDDYKNWENRTLIFPKDRVCRAKGLQWGYKIYKEANSVDGTEDNHYKVYGNNTTIKATDGKDEADMTSNKGWILWLIKASYVDIENLNFNGNRSKRFVNENEYLTRDYFIQEFDKRNRKDLQHYYHSNLVISNSNHIYLNNITSTDAIADNIYLGWLKDEKYGEANSYITLENCNLSFAFRNNLTLSSCTNCKVNRGSYKSAKGISPEAGIDIECDAKREHCLENIIISSTNIEGNYGAGISSSQVGKPTNITIQNNYIANNRISERTCDYKGSAISVGLSNSIIENNIFENFTANNVGEHPCRSLIDFYSTEKTDGNVTVINNTFKNLYKFKESNRPYIYIHIDNGGRHTITDNSFIDVDMIKNDIWYIDNHEDDSNESTIRNNIFKKE